MSTLSKEKIKEGLLGRKLGMTQIWNQDGKIVPVTLVEVLDNKVSQIKTKEKDGYNAVQIAYGQRKEKNISKPVLSHLKKANISTASKIAEFNFQNNSKYSLGDIINIDFFSEGDLLDITSVSKGKGLAGVMKLHGFKGVGASHGAHRNHRKPGSIGGCSTPGRVFKGLRMAGRMGQNQVTIKSLSIIKIDKEKNLLYIKGSIAGSKNQIISLKKSLKG